MIVRAGSLHLPLADASVDLIVTSPPYYGQRSYRDGGEHFDGQIGAEPHPAMYLSTLWMVMHECWRVLKPSGSCFVNLGDKRSGSSSPGTTSGLGIAPQGERSEIRGSYSKAAFGRPKSKMLLPHRFAIGCEDGAADPEGIGWVVRQDGVWGKLNGLPESVRDRQADRHEYLFHLTKQGDYYAAIDEIREPVKDPSVVPGRRHGGAAWGETKTGGDGSQHTDANPLGRTPGSVWMLANEPLSIPAWAKERLGLPDHFAAFPSELPRRCILGWSPSGICTACGEGRRPVVDQPGKTGGDNWHGRDDADPERAGYTGGQRRWEQRVETPDRILGYACACPDASARTAPSVVLDVFGGTGTTAMVARALGRTGISIDLSADYCRLAKWRVFESGHGAKAVRRTNTERQGAML